MSDYTKEYLELAHKNSFCNQADVLADSLCGCFYCNSTFLPTDIIEWIIEENGETAICPNCNVDSVLSSKWPVTNPLFLKDMNLFWFRVI